jgi:CelD/BcsL family acetyltransferase involved in cellulose biosynthesis
MSLSWRRFTFPWWQQEPARWEAWVGTAGLPLFCRTAWLDAVVAHYAPQLQVWVVFAAGEPLGALPLAAGRWRGIPVWHWLGSELCPDHLDLIAAPSDQARLWASFLAEVVPAHAPPLLFWEGVREGSALLTQPRPKGLTLWARPPRAVPFLDLARLPDRAALLAHLTPKLRQELTYLDRRVARDAPDARLREISDTEAILATLRQLAAWSCQHRGAASAWAEARFVALHEQLAPRLAAEGRLGLFTFGPAEGPWAIAYGFRDGTTYRYYQPAFDRRAARYSPAKLLIARLMALGAQEGWQEFDFLLGEESYKFEWNPAVRREADWRMGKGLFGRLVTGGATWLR